MSKMADSSKQRTRLRRKNEKEKKKLNELLGKLGTLQEADVPTLQNAVDGIYPWHVQTTGSSVQIPLDMRKKIVDLHTLLQRYQEEEKLLRREMKSVMLHFQNVIGALQEEKYNVMLQEDTGQARSRYESLLSTERESIVQQTYRQQSSCLRKP